MPFINAPFSAISCGLASHLIFNKFDGKLSTIAILLILILLPLIPVFLLAPHYATIARALFVGYGTYYGTLATSIACYRLCPFHPLAKYPGPLLAKLSKLWGVNHTRGGKYHITLLDLHRRYGPVVRTGPNELSISDVSAASHVLGPDGMPKGPVWEGRKPPSSQHDSLIGVQDIAPHLKQRKTWNRAFNTSQVKAYELILKVRLDQLLQLLKQKANQGESSVDLARVISLFAYDFMGDVSFGGGFELMRDGDVHGLWELMENGIRVQSYGQHIPWAKRLVFSWPGLGEASQKLLIFLVDISQKRMQRGSTGKVQDLSSYLLDEHNPAPNPPPFAKYVIDAFLAVVAGSDTVATALSCVFFYLLSEHTIFNQLRHEIDLAFPPNDKMSPTDDTSKLAGMPLLNAVIDEALRLQPPVPTGLQRIPEAGSGGKMVGTIFVPEGTAVYVPPYALHRDARYFSPDPDRFRPERWLQDESKPHGSTTMNTDRSAFIPYSAGPMNCAGKLLAQLELRLVVATLVQKFDMSLEPGWDRANWEKDLEDFFAFKKGALPTRIKPRAN
ncbi:high nitrogen upregulated cytochrome P450 monooxygenase 2 [Mycena rebaudengoi]|nr:high nitrogen upregulated cytochrome P450 monooxygenase 2 [Mycena rebaudengoi]